MGTSAVLIEKPPSGLKSQPKIRPQQKPAALPTLDQIADDAGLISQLAGSVIAALYQRAARLEAELRAHVLTSNNIQATGQETADRLLLIDEAASLLATSNDTLYTKWKELPFAFKDVDGKIKFSEKGIVKYINKRTNK